MTWTEQPTPQQIVDLWAKTAPEVMAPRFFTKGPCRALIHRHPMADTTVWRWHISVSTETRVPSWDELVDAAHELRPGVPFVVGIPPRSWWMSVHPYVLHLYEMHDDALIAEWRANAQGDEPS